MATNWSSHLFIALLRCICVQICARHPSRVFIFVLWEKYPSLTAKFVLCSDGVKKRKVVDYWSFGWNSLPLNVDVLFAEVWKRSLLFLFEQGQPRECWKSLPSRTSRKLSDHFAALRTTPARSINFFLTLSHPAQLFGASELMAFIHSVTTFNLFSFMCSENIE